MSLLEIAQKRRKKRYVQLTKTELKSLKKPRAPRIAPHRTILKNELELLRSEVQKAKARAFKPSEKIKTEREVLPTRIAGFDELISAHGFERGSTILISGGCGTGKTTFALQSLYFGALRGEKGIYISIEEEPYKLKKHMMNNFGWDFEKLEKEGKLAIIKYDALEIARSVEAAITNAKEELVIDFREFELPFRPDRLAFDSLSALSIAFGSTESYRRYIRYLFEKFEKYNSVNFVLTETEQDPKIYSRAGIEEFLADGVIVLYNIKVQNFREKALEILKLRSSNHEKTIVPFEITSEGITVYPRHEVFREE